MKFRIAHAALLLFVIGALSVTAHAQGRGQGQPSDNSLVGQIAALEARIAALEAQQNPSVAARKRVNKFETPAFGFKLP